MKHRKIIRLLVIPAALFVILLIVLVMCRRSAICGETYSDRANYAKTLGYSISADSETVQNIVIPAVFGSVYENYNALQKQCGFDLSLYKGEDAVQYTYIITDYTDDSGNTLDNIRMNLIIVSGRIVQSLWAFNIGHPCPSLAKGSWLAARLACFKYYYYS